MNAVDQRIRLLARHDSPARDDAGARWDRERLPPPPPGEGPQPHCQGPFIYEHQADMTIYPEAFMEQGANIMSLRGAK